MADGAAAHPTIEWHHIRIEPTETALDPEQVETSFERLHRLDATIVFSPVSDGEHIDYDAGTGSTEINRLERILRGCFPNDYGFTRAKSELETHFGAPDEVMTVELTGRGERR